MQVMGVPDPFVMCLASDALGRVWMGTEDQGVWLFDAAQPPERRWKQFTTAQGLGDDHIYALACDHQGRVWAGHLNHGVSVYDGQSWRSYDVLAGPVGERVFDIAVCPTDGDIWIATNCGLSRYSPRLDRWSGFGQAEGLPPDALQCVAFDDRGNIIVGTQCQGLALASAADGYKNWRLVQGPQSLPDDRINDVLVTRAGVILAATTSGLARSLDGGLTWRTLRGQEPGSTTLLGTEPEDDSYGHPVLDPEASRRAGPFSRNLLRQDYVACLAQDRDGLLWIGYRQQGYEVRDARAIREVAVPLANGASNEGAARSGFVRAILPRSNGLPLIGLYGDGQQDAVAALSQVARPLETPLAQPASRSFPSPAPAPSHEQLEAWLSEVSQVAKQPEEAAPLVVPLEDDWSTQGAWLGRYGRYWACLSAINSPNDFEWGAGERAIEYAARIGPEHESEDSLRYWIEWLYTSSRESLEMPPTYYDSRLVQGYAPQSDALPGQNGSNRRQAEWDDHGEVYPMSLEGPNLFCSLRIPPGSWVLSLYEFNKDGHIGPNRWRDYGLSLRRHDTSHPLDNIDGFDTQPELARGRVRDFRGGVWKRFHVQGPLDLSIEVSRAHSFNTLLAAVMLDTPEEKPAPYFGPVSTSAASPKADDVAGHLLQVLESLQLSHPNWCARHSRRLYLDLARLYERDVTTHPVFTPSTPVSRIEQAATCCYRLRRYDEWEKDLRASGQAAARDIETALRWDGGAVDSGRGREYVTSYLRRRSKPPQVLAQPSADKVQSP